MPGSDPGYDNILWPLNRGGRTLAQPLAGGEYVVNSSASAMWGPLLEWINGGGRPGSGSSSHDNSLNIYGDVLTPAASGRELQRDLRRRKGYEANRSAS